jgi:hypothetical protein
MPKSPSRGRIVPVREDLNFVDYFGTTSAISGKSSAENLENCL